MSPRSSARTPAAWLPAVAGPVATLLVLVALQALAATPFRVSSPELVCFVPVLGAALAGGAASGFASLALCVLFALRFLSLPGRPFEFAPDEAQRLAVSFAVLAVLVAMAGVLRRRGERLRSESADTRGTLRYRELVEDLDAIVWEAEAEPFRFRFVGGAVGMIGFPLERWLREPGFWFDRVHPEDREALREGIARVLAGGDRHGVEYRVVAADGHVLWMRDLVHVVRDVEGRARRLRGVLVDITEARAAEAALEARAREYQALLEQASDAILILDAGGRYIDANTRACELLGHTREALLALDIRDTATAADRDEVAARLAAMHRGESVRAERWLRRSDGTAVLVDLSARQLEDGRIISIVRDVSERNRMLSMLAATLESTTDGILVVDLAGQVVRYNRQFLELWRIPEDVAASGDDDQALAFVLDQLRDPDEFIGKVRDLYATPDASSFDVLHFKDGRVFERYSMPQQVDGESVGRVWSFRDVTERRRAAIALRQSEEQLRQAQKMEAIGQLAGGIAHDFNNLLTAILGYGQLVEEGLGPGHPLHAGALEVCRAAERAASLTRQLLAFSRRQVLEPRVIDLRDVVADLHSMLQRVIGEHISLTLHPSPSTGRVRVDPGQVEQVIMNLVINARDAMPEGGLLTIETESLELDDAYAALHIPLKPGRYVMLAVSDTGSGMDAATQARVFEPFFTTKVRGKGTGLGLATAYGIVRQSGGHIWAYSEPGHGSTFKVYLPEVEAPIDPEEPRAVRAPLVGGRETVLLVEDEPFVRTLVEGTLVRAGYHALIAEDGPGALALATRHADRIELLITDVIMPGMSGREVSERILQLHPETRVLFISGYTDEAIMRHGVLERGVAFLQKPFTLDAFSRKVREVLDAPVRSRAERGGAAEDAGAIGRSSR